MPDGLQLLSPFPSLAVAAMTADIRVGTFVAAAPLRKPRAAAWDAHTLSVLTNGRFDFGIGTGRPQAEQQTTELGLPFGIGQGAPLPGAGDAEPPGRSSTATSTRRSCSRPADPAVLALAAARADIVSLAKPALTPREELRQLTQELRELAGVTSRRHRAGDEPVRGRYDGTAAVDDASDRRAAGGAGEERQPDAVAREPRGRWPTSSSDGETSSVRRTSPSTPTYLDDLAPVVELLDGR